MFNKYKFRNGTSVVIQQFRKVVKVMKLFNILLKFFYYFNHFFGLVIVKIDLNKKIVSKSKLKIIYALLWMLFSIINYENVARNAYQGFDNIYPNQITVGDTEMIVSLIMVVVITSIYLKNGEKSVQLFTALIKLSDICTSWDELKNDSISNQLIYSAIFGELELGFTYITNIFWIYKDGTKNLLNLNPFENSFICVGIIVYPAIVFVHFSLFFAFCIDLIRKFIKLINQKIEGVLDVANVSNDFAKVTQDIREIDKLYEQALEVIKLFEQCYGLTILILQCICLFVGVNQVKY